MAIPAAGLNDYNNLNALAGLKSSAANSHDPAVVHKVAAQFESLYVSMMLKTMREATRSLNPDDPMSSDQSKFYEDMFDEQMGLYMSQHGGVGLTDVLVRQLGGAASHSRAQNALSPLPRKVEPAQESTIPSAASNKVKPITDEHPVGAAMDTRQGFIQTLLPYARQAAAELGISPRVILAQAALETGWGQSLKHGFFNLFGIKADTNWQGGRLRVPTLEVDHSGQIQRTQAVFRNYGSVAESMRDYVAFMRSHPRFSKALQAGCDEKAFIHHMGQSGYATDPQYAAKLNHILGALGPGLTSG